MDINESYFVAEAGERDQKLIFKYIQRMDFMELKIHLNTTKDSIDIMNIHDKSGYSPIHYAAYKNMVKATQVIIEFLLQDDNPSTPHKELGETGGHHSGVKKIYGRTLAER